MSAASERLARLEKKLAAQGPTIVVVLPPWLRALQRPATTEAACTETPAADPLPAPA